MSYSEATVIGVYEANGTVREIAELFRTTKQFVWCVRNGKIRRRLTENLILGVTVDGALTAEEWSEQGRESREKQLTHAQIDQRLAIASCLKKKHRGGCILADENIDVLLPLG